MVDQPKLRRVIVTRPAHQCSSWVARLHAAGLETLTIPLLDIVAVSQEQSLEVIKQEILRLDENELVIFVSQNAVLHAFEWIERYWPQFPLGLRCMAIGSKTEQYIEKILKQVYAATNPLLRSVDLTMTSESLLSSAQLQEVKNKKILIFRGVGGRTKLSEELECRGAIVRHCELYHRVLPGVAAVQLSNAELNWKQDLFTVFSGETLQNLHTSLHLSGDFPWRSLPILVPSERVAAQALALGFEYIIQAKNASEEGMWLALDHYISNQRVVL
ncbi:MAG: uroporphyrinogen-III synthase [Lentisphaeria bacterium]|jgi:uroporphyrinogen-III synthase